MAGYRHRQCENVLLAVVVVDETLADGTTSTTSSKDD
jgi:hypothetical protein